METGTKIGKAVLKAVLAGAVCVFCAGSPSTVLADGPLISGIETETEAAEGPALERGTAEAGEAAAEADSGSQNVLTGEVISEAELSDTKIEYKELEALIRTGNSTALNQQSSYTGELTNYQTAYDAFSAERRSMLNKAEELEDEGGDETLIAFYEQNAQILSASAKQMKRTLNSLASSSGQSSRNRTVWSVVKSAQSLMVSCRQMEHQTAAAAKMAEASQAAYERKVKEQVAGMATEEDVLTAKKSLLSARISLQSTKDSEAQLKRQLTRLLGISSEELELGEIPSVTEKELAEINLEEDKALAVISNSGVKSVRNSSARGDASRRLRAQQLEEAEAEASITADEQYASIAALRLQRDGAATAFEAAQKDYHALQTKYQAGITNKGNYLSGEAAYLREKAAYQAAEAELRLAYDSYRWMLKGVN